MSEIECPCREFRDFGGGSQFKSHLKQMPHPCSCPGGRLEGANPGSAPARPVLYPGHRPKSRATDTFLARPETSESVQRDAAFAPPESEIGMVSFSCGAVHLHSHVCCFAVFPKPPQLVKVHLGRILVKTRGRLQGSGKLGLGPPHRKTTSAMLLLTPSAMVWGSGIVFRVLVRLPPLRGGSTCISATPCELSSSAQEHQQHDLR